jgi:hypothetical protein
MNTSLRCNTGGKLGKGIFLAILSIDACFLGRYTSRLVISKWGSTWTGAKNAITSRVANNPVSWRSKHGEKSFLTVRVLALS